MKQIVGKTVFPGVAFGPVFFYAKPHFEADTTPAADTDAEWRVCEAAFEQADAELEVLFEKSKSTIGEAEALIIDVQRMMLKDEDFLEAVKGFVYDEKCRAACAVERAGKQFYDVFDAIEDPYMHARAPDILDAAHRVCRILLGVENHVELREAAIVVADDLAPSDTLSLDRRLIRAFVTRKGSTTSHTAILARTLKIPSIVQAHLPEGAAAEKELDGKKAAVDGHAGILYIDPDAATLAALKQHRLADEAEDAELEKLRGLPSVTTSGQKIEITANIGNGDDLESAVAHDAEGIGLFRSEFLFLGRERAPSEDEQYQAYKAALEAMKGKRVVVRTLDIGADKKADYLVMEKEENPALGMRAIRLCFDRPELFKTQLRALYRAAVHGKLAVMFPMIASLWELRRCNEMAAEARASLEQDGVPTADIELGMMVETPAAALCADELAREAAFFSVGTNDLTQYTLAADRQNALLEPYTDSHHPAVLKLLEAVAAAAQKAGIWAGICGELAGDHTLTGRFIEMGYTELSVSPPLVLKLRKHVREL